MDLPKEFKERMQKMLGDEYTDFIKTYELKPTTGIRFNPLKTHETVALEPIPWAKDGYYYTSGTPGKSVFHDMGLYYIQEPSAMSVAGVLDPKPHEIILDLCASPGGKSTQIATLMRNKGLLISNEIIPKRAQVLADNISRLGITNTIVLNETPQKLSQKFGGFFDKILVDAPCSGEGMFRKNPEAITEWSEENVKMCAERQLDILNTISNTLKEDGILVYSTCTFSPEEDEQVVEQFLNIHPEFDLIDIDHMFFSKGIPKNTRSNMKNIEKTARLFPHKLRGEGHFIACFKKNATGETNVKRLKSNIARSNYAVLSDFLKKTQITLPDGMLLDYKNHIYLAPPLSPNLDTLKVQQAGLYLGEIDKKKNFVPSHNLALALSTTTPPHTTKSIELDFEQLKTYISGNTLTCNSTLSGWTLLTYKNNPIGWGKISNGNIKNHYPKHLRKNSLES